MTQLYCQKEQYTNKTTKDLQNMFFLSLERMFDESR